MRKNETLFSIKIARFFSKNFFLWRLITKIQLFHQNFSFSRKFQVHQENFKLITKISDWSRKFHIDQENFRLITKISVFHENFRLITKISVFHHYISFLWKSEFFTKIKIFQDSSWKFQSCHEIFMVFMKISKLSRKFTIFHDSSWKFQSFAKISVVCKHF